MRGGLKEGFFWVSVLIILVTLFGSVITGDGKSLCNGSIAECDENEEFIMDSEINRRILADYINYTPLKPENPASPGAKPGQPYKSGCRMDKYCREERHG